jgi:histidinol-phosphate/aromatic aminotransferase/cobyric acid decarboxylase-like protein
MKKVEMPEWKHSIGSAYYYDCGQVKDLYNIAIALDEAVDTLIKERDEYHEELDKAIEERDRLIEALEKISALPYKPSQERKIGDYETIADKALSTIKAE